MRNLKLVKQYHFHADELENAWMFCIDSDGRFVYFLSQDCLYKLHLLSNQFQLCCNLLAEGILLTDSQINIVGLAYLFIEQSVCLATSSGDVLLFNTLTEKLECAGTFENGIKTMKWSPDQEIVILVTGNDSLILMSHDFEPICESAIHSENFGEGKPITIGWGAKETQFHGSEGKAAAKIKSQTEQKIFPFDDRKIRVSWCGDGQFFVMNSVTPDTEMRKLRVWNREGVLQYTSETLNGLEQALHWQPSGSFIASTLRKSNKHEVSFFERNCLPRGEFTLPFESKQIKVNELMWNSDSTLLAVWAEDLALEIVSDNSQLNGSYLQIWTVNNFHWYLKQTLISSPSTFSSIRAIFWDPENVYQLHVLCSNGRYLNCVWAWNINRSRGITERDLGIVAVIDGAQVLVTPFRNLVVPPPLSAFTFNLPKAVNHIINGPQSRSNDILVIMEDDKLALFTTECLGPNNDPAAVKMGAAGGSGFKQQIPPHYLKGIYELIWPRDFELSHSSFFHHWVWVNSSTLFFAFTSSNISIIAKVHCDMNSDNTDHFEIEKCIPLEGQVILISPLPNEMGVAIELSDGSLFKYFCDAVVIDPWLRQDGSQLKLPQPCYNISFICLDSKNYVLALSETCHLYINDFELASNCSSFSFTDSFLLFTSLTHELHCLSKQLLQEDVADIMKRCVVTEQLRNLERGSRIVMVIPSDTKVILQMPRGNLEAIYPRCLVLHLAWKYLNSLQYKEALLLMRKHRINMNLIFDHNPTVFLNNVNEFVKQVDDINCINLFLSSLQQEDVTFTLYKTTYAALEYSSEKLGKRQQYKNKVDVVCDAMLKAMENLDVNKYFLGIMTAHAKKSNPELDIALEKIMTLIRDKNLSTDMNGMTSDVALKHLLYLVDVNDLYNVALGTYDFDLVVLVAEKSQKDPKEYLPFLNGLQKLEPNYRKYTIDKYLKRYVKALHHISKCGDEHFNECVTFVQSHSLYSESMKIFPKNSHHYKMILDIFGNHLLEKHHYEEAGIMFMKGGVYEKALSAFKKSGNWKQGFCAAFKMNCSPADLIFLAREFAGLLKNNKSYIDASHVLEVYAMDHEESIVALVEGREWDRCFLMVHKYQRLDIAESHLFPALMDNYSNLLSTLDILKSTFERHMKRLIIVREEKQKKMAYLHDDGDDGFTQESDLYSDTSTVTGMTSSMWSAGSGSRFTSRTSRNKRKQNRKKVILKEGSLFEDIALLESLTEIITQADGLKDEFGSLIRALVLHGYESEAAKLQLQLDDFMRYMISCKSEIWLPEESEENGETIQTGPMSTVNNIITAPRQNFNCYRSIPREYTRFLHPPSLSHDIDWKMDSLKS